MEKIGRSLITNYS